MATRAFDDWSPASVFGATDLSPRDEKSPERRPHTKPSAGRWSPRDDNNVSEHEDQPVLARQPTTRRSLVDFTTVLLTKRKASHAEPAQQDDEDSAARAIQARLQMWLLYRRERESIEHVDRLRLELESAAATAISDWVRRCLTRFGILEHAAQLRYQRVIRQDACELICGWICQQRDASLFRRKLRRRIHARRRLYCWWRRLQWEKRCRRRQERKEEHWRQAVENARSLITRVVWTYVKRRRRHQHTRGQAVVSIGAFVIKATARKRAKEEADRRRSRRAASLRILNVLTRWQLRLKLSRWLKEIQHQRSAKVARQHHAACVLQRLVRVMLTAFRLMRRRDAATRIQSIVRGQQTQRRYTAHLLQRRRVASINLQRVVRGFLARRRVQSMLQQLRERFKCLNCGLIEPGGLYCKFCGRKRTTFDVLGPGIAAGAITTDAELRKKRKKKQADDTCTVEAATGLPPAAPLPLVRPHQAQRLAHGPSITASVIMMDLPDMMPLSPTKTSNSTALSSALLSPRYRSTQLSSPPVQPPSYPRKPQGANHTGGRPGNFHRSVSVAESTRLPVTGLASVDKTRQRAEALMQQDNHRFQHGSQSTMNLHMQRLQKGGKAASR